MGKEYAYMPYGTDRLDLDWGLLGSYHGSTGFDALTFM